MISCPHCGTTEHYRVGLSKTGLQRYLCHGCKRKYTSETKARPKMIFRHKQCLQCGVTTTNARFCSSSCAAIYNNKRYPKRQKFCKRCGVRIHGRPSVCRDCNRNTPDRSKQTIGEIQKAAKYQISALLRHVARQTYKHSQLPYICYNCGYDKHVEICHVRAINTFPEDTPVSVVSGIDNLVALCPNCHWEFDNGLLHLQANDSATQNDG